MQFLAIFAHCATLKQTHLKKQKKDRQKILVLPLKPNPQIRKRKVDLTLSSCPFRPLILVVFPQK